MLDNLSKDFFYRLARSRSIRAIASRYGMTRRGGFARRFIAGETIGEAIVAARAAEARGFLHTLDYLGESVASLHEAEAATAEYLRIVDAVVKAGIERNLSLKLTQLGLDVDPAAAERNLRTILDHADGFFIRIDMESSAYTEATLDIFESLWTQGYRHVGVVLQSELYRTEPDLERVLALGARVRLVKGAYKEASADAFPRKADVDAAYQRLAAALLSRGTYPAIATHDPAMITFTRQHATTHGITPDRFEFQMLYGIRRDLQAALLAAGYRVRIYIPFGREWFPYFMRRLGERPANVAFVLRGLLSDRG
jgi:proline dehydrogenase